MMKGNGFSSSSTFWACLLVALTHIVGIFSHQQHQFSDDNNRPNIIDITVNLTNLTVPYPSGLYNYSRTGLVAAFMGKDTVTGSIRVGTHMGTHVVSPGHFSTYYGNYSVDMLDLTTLNGQVLVVDSPRNTNITAEVLQSLNLPAGLKRVIFRTSNTDRKLVAAPNLVTDYTGLTAEGASWLVQHTSIEFVGIDYLSIGVHEDKANVYANLFGNQTMVSVEFLKLDNVKPGFYTVYCLPLRLEAEASPVRCILVE